MDRQGFRPNITTFSVLAILGTGYSAWLYSHHMLTGVDRVDGIIGVVLGLYICSHPASTLVDMLFYRRSIRYQFSSTQFVVFWIFLNVLVLFIGAIAIFMGTTRLIGKG